ncbi:MAG TPA: sugar phosphate isomerase/epimerase family protein [Armatimonadota bacterium]|nr:sugar phosphate isomerase/epimerase family protein [Armatimonadota bacterium]
MLSFAVSPCSNPEMSLAEVLSAYAQIGYTRFEAFTSWCKSALSADADPDAYLGFTDKYGIDFSSIHLPPITEDHETSIANAAKTCRLGAELGVRAALVKPTDLDRDAPAVKALLDEIDGLPVIPVLQNHAGSAIETLEDYDRILSTVDDARLKCTLEVGQFHSVGIDWREACEALDRRFELVHIKDQVGRQSVPFGTGEIDLPGLLARLAEDGYPGDVVVEMEVQDRENTLQYLRDALEYVNEHSP